ncbi:hypothetical protein GS429_14315 [Natronorubrum sp. JWXQ-INN-674]|uniref:Uncharacterized protein n=1 Tax=Natronorubrum halalkaliphilum TaxID=2691917 RepID=A0A6B0VNM0_9EURY|nr:hypothetical protein [Natronorubrum halalkaliphilum]MXV63220.1 hypothetical protein [Natronorubrum halalkaliphilum]
MTSNLEDARWTELLEDTTAIAEEYRENGWDAVVLDPEAVSPVENEERTGFDVRVSADEYELVESLIERGDVAVTAADVYYRPPESDDEPRIALAVERDEDTETAVFVPLTYDLAESRSVFETALKTEELLLHVTTETDDADGWVSFSHEDPSLFLEEADVRGWFDEA